LHQPDSLDTGGQHLIRTIIFALLFATPVVAALEISDPEGDPKVQPLGLSGPPSGADLRSLTLIEDELGFTFTLDAGNLEDPFESPLYTGTYRIRFEFNGVPYQVVWTRFVTFEPALEPSLRVSLRDANDAVLASLSYETPFTVFVQRGQIIDATGSIPALGTTLSSIHVESRMSPFDVVAPNAVSMTVEDRMPDEGNVDYAVTFGPQTVGSMRATAQQAFRTSNGGAEAFLYLINLTGGGPGTTIQVETVPMGWKVFTPTGTFNGARAVVPILVETAFFHQHGAVGTARLAFNQGSNTARVDIGINYLDPSRPDGHHPTLAFHSARTTKDAINDGAETASGMNLARAIWFNTNSEDPSDEGVPVASYSATRDGISGYAWVAALSPALRDGIHFAAGAGIIEVPITYQAQSPGRLHGTLSWIPEGLEPEVVGTIEPMEPVQLSPGSPVKVKGTVVTQERRIDVEGTGQLRLDLLLEAEPILAPYGPNSHPFWEPGGIMQIPLYDYHPPVQDQLAQITNVRVTIPAEVAVLPGVPGLLVTEIAGPGRYNVDVFGALAHWVTIDGRNIIITPPTDAAIGDFGEIVIRASDASDSLAWGIARTRIIVSDTNSLPPVPAENKEATTIQSFVVVLVLLGVASSRRLLQRGGRV
jgi:hypothetical protein